MKKFKVFNTITLILVLAVSLVMLAACNPTDVDGGEAEDTVPLDESGYTPDEQDYNYEYDSSTAKYIAFGADGISANGASVSGNTATITADGDYILSGESTDSQVIVKTSGEVRLILNNLQLKSQSSAAIFIQKSSKATILLPEGTDSTIEDSANTELNSDGEPTAAIFSKADLIISGEGKLTVNAYYNNAIQSKDNLKILSATLNLTSVDDGIIGKDSLYIENSTITADCDGDGIKSTNDSDSAKGVVLITGGSLDITAGADGIQSANYILIKSGVFNIVTGGGSANASTDSGWGQWGSVADSTSDSAKAIKASYSITIESGVFAINSSDDSIHSNDGVTVSGGSFNISSGDDGIHADGKVNLTGGNAVISKSYEGIEGANIVISGGTWDITASDDGINVAGGNDSSGIDRPGAGGFKGMGEQSSSSSSYRLDITGGRIAINATGDGLDSNGSITMSGGVVTVDGPTSDNNGALDFDGSFSLTGGTLIAVGSSGMAQNPASSNVYGIVVKGSNLQGIIHIADSDGSTVLNYKPAKKYASIVFFSADLKKDTYTIYLGGSCTGTDDLGLYENSAEYSGGSQAGTVTISSYTTSSGSGGGGGGGRPF